MSLARAISKLPLGGMQLSRARIRRIGPDGSVHVGLDPEAAREVRCDILQAVAPERPWAVGDEVLLATSEAPEARPIILGVVAAALATGPDASAEGAAAPPTSRETVPETTAIRNTRIVVEAGEELTLKCGGGTIKIRKDGKIIVSGEHVLTRARGTQRIKGGSVAIN